MCASLCKFIQIEIVVEVVGHVKLSNPLKDLTEYFLLAFLLESCLISTFTTPIGAEQGVEKFTCHPQVPYEIKTQSLPPPPHQCSYAVLNDLWKLVEISICLIHIFHQIVISYCHTANRFEIGLELAFFLFSSSCLCFRWTYLFSAISYFDFIYFHWLYPFPFNWCDIQVNASSWFSGEKSNQVLVIKKKQDMKDNYCLFWIPFECALVLWSRSYSVIMDSTFSSSFPISELHPPHPPKKTKKRSYGQFDQKIWL